MKVIGYILALIGFCVVLVTKVPSLTAKATFLPAQIISNGVYVGMGLVLLGIIILIFSNKGTSTGKEVPIYHGDKIVGYRRHQ